MGMLDLYGIKEVADVVFWDTETGNPVLYLDTLKVSTIEETADQTEARGGKGNPPLIIWDYGKEITLTLEDALFSMKSLNIMHNSKSTVDATISEIERGGKFTTASDATGTSAIPSAIASLAGVVYFDETGTSVAAANIAANTTYLYSYKQAISVGAAETISVTSEDFPGTYRITGDTYARSQKTGKDEFFQFEVPLAKVNPEQTITMQADGDPSTFSMTVRVMRPDDGVMMRLTKYPMA